MRIGALHIEFMIFDAQSLKEKRRVMRSVKDQLRNTFNVAVAEVGSNDKWQIGEIGVTTVGNERRFVNSVLTKVEDFLETQTAIRIIDLEMEIF